MDNAEKKTGSQKGSKIVGKVKGLFSGVMFNPFPPILKNLPRVIIFDLARNIASEKDGDTVDVPDGKKLSVLIFSSSLCLLSGMLFLAFAFFHRQNPVLTRLVVSFSGIVLLVRGGIGFLILPGWISSSMKKSESEGGKG